MKNREDIFHLYYIKDDYIKYLREVEQRVYGRIKSFLDYVKMKKNISLMKMIIEYGHIKIWLRIVLNHIFKHCLVSNLIIV